MAVCQSRIICTESALVRVLLFNMSGGRIPRIRSAHTTNCSICTHACRFFVYPHIYSGDREHDACEWCYILATTNSQDTLVVIISAAVAYASYMCASAHLRVHLSSLEANEYKNENACKIVDYEAEYAGSLCACYTSTGALDYNYY